MSKKKLVLSELFAHCQEHGEFTFDNDLVKKVGKKHDFGNPFDATKNERSGRTS